MFGPTLEEHEPVDPAEALMREVGAQLRRARVERGEDLEQVAEYLRIKEAYLRAIEDGDLSTMPGRAYALGFLRSYADHLGFDGDDLIERIKTTVDDLTDRAHLHIRTPLPESRLPRTPLVVLSLAVVAGIYAGWTYVEGSGDAAVETVAEVPDELRRLPGQPPPSEPAAPAREPATATGSDPGTGSDDDLPPAGESTAPAPASSLGDPPTRLQGSRLRGERAPSPRTGAPAEEAPSGTAARSTGAGSASADAAGEPPGISAGTGGGTPATTGAARSRGTATGNGTTAVPEAGPDEVAAQAAESTSQVDEQGEGAAAGSGARGTTASASGGDDGAGLTAREVLAALERADTTNGDAQRAPQVHESVNADARVLLRATGRSWVRISSEDGDYLRTTTLQEGDVFLVPNRSDLHLWTGNAGALDVIVDGTRLPPLGADGSVMRSVSLDPERLMAGVDRQP